MIRAADRGTDVLAADPKAMLALSDSPELKDVAEEVEHRIRAALGTLTT